MKINVLVDCILDVPEEHAKRILEGDQTAFLETMYTPDDGTKRGKWWIEGVCVVQNSCTTINV